MFKVSHNVLRWVLVYLKIGEIMAGTCVQLSLCTSLSQLKNNLPQKFKVECHQMSPILNSTQQ